MGSLMVIGLGNPIGMYEWKARHNVGFMVVDEVASEHGVVLGPASDDIIAMIGEINGSPTGRGFDDVMLVEPQTTMNRSGEAVKEILDRYGMPDDVILVQDDVDMEPGKLRVRRRGHDGGHLGVRSVLDGALAGWRSTPVRVKVGVGRPPRGVSMFDWVTGEIDDEDYEVIKNSTSRAALAVGQLIDGADLWKVMDDWNDR